MAAGSLAAQARPDTTNSAHEMDDIGGRETQQAESPPVAPPRVRIVIQAGRNKGDLYRVPFESTARTGDVMRLVRNKNKEASGKIRGAVTGLYWLETIEAATITIDDDGPSAPGGPVETAVTQTTLHPILSVAYHHPQRFLGGAAHPTSFAATYGKFLESSETADALLVGSEFKKLSLLVTVALAVLCGIVLGIVVGLTTSNVSYGLLVGFGSGTFISVFSALLCWFLKKE